MIRGPAGGGRLRPREMQFAAAYGLLAVTAAAVAAWTGCQGNPAREPVSESPGHVVAEPVSERADHVAAARPRQSYKPIVADVDPFGQLIRTRDELRSETAAWLQRIVPRLPAPAAARFDRLRRVSGEEQVLRELLRWSGEAAHAALLQPAEHAELKQLAQRWRDWEWALTEITRQPAASKEHDHDQHAS